MAAPVKIVFGTMTLGREGAEQSRVHTLPECAAILDTYQSFGGTEIDTARAYGGGSCEEFLGQLDLPGRGLTVATKLHVSEVYNHSPSSLRRGLLDSLKALGREKVDLWYLHVPDHSVPYEDTLREVNALYEEGYFARLGISNYSAWETAELCEIAIRNGWKKPDVYQGVYSALHRGVEPELLPCLRRYGLAFYQFNPLAGGILTDRHDRSGGSVDEGGRFDPKRKQGTEYRRRYWNDAYFEALDVIRPAAQRLGMSTAEAALRWSRHHGQLRGDQGDAIIIGASSAAQLTENLTSLDKGPLPEEMLAAFEDGWARVRGIIYPYFK